MTKNNNTNHNGRVHNTGEGEDNLCDGVVPQLLSSAAAPLGYS